MTLSFQSRYSPPLDMPEVAMERDNRAVQLGRLIKEKRLDLGLNRPSFVREMARHGEEITPDYLNKLESGTASLARASLEVRESIRIVLGFSPDKWQGETGLYTTSDQPSSATFSAAARGWNVPKPEPRPISDALLEAADMFGDRKEWSGLREYKWQRYLEGLHHKSRPVTPEQWLAVYLDLKDRFDPPETEE